MFDLYDNAKITKGLLPKKCFSFDQRDIAEMSVLGAIYQALSFIQWCIGDTPRNPINIEYLVDELLNQPFYHDLVDNLYNNWVQKNKFIVDKSRFKLLLPEISGESSHLAATFLLNRDFYDLLISLSDPVSKGTLAYLILKKIVEKKYLAYGTDF